MPDADDTNKSERRNRNIKISIRVTDKELKQLRERCGGMTLARYLRNLGLGAPYIKKADANLVLALGRLGSNLNQVARHANTENKLDQKVLSEISAIREVITGLIHQNLKDDD